MSEQERPATRLWREALAQLDQLLGQSAEQRDATLATLEGTQPQLHAMLVSLLNAEARAERAGFMEPPRRPEGALHSGSLLGPYRIESRIGEGGMGEVWLARRHDGLYEGQVAIKTLHPYFGGGALRERFLREAQILGRLQHPNIARLLDAGVAADGSVYLVLEYVQGVPLDAWCDERRLGLDARLRLFLDVCAAVAQAHANLVVHRDIKPSNILVTEQGQVKLLDFGVAKLLEADTAAAGNELTRMTGRIFTPEYAAPEQILGESVTTATDVYSLGALLYVLLTGNRPYGRRDTAVDIERAVLHDEPVLASDAISASAEDIAARRSTTPARLRRALAGDIDVILARALRKKPAERYASVAALADDIQRHLAHEPILARPESLATRTRKFVRRHRMGVAAAALIIVAVGAGISGVWWQSQVARNEARKATAIKDFLVGVFERNSTSHPDGARARQTTAAELLAQASEHIRTGLSDAPEVRSELLGVMARLYSNMEMQKDALPLLKEQLATQRALLGPTHTEVARTLGWLASSQSQSGDYAGAIASATEAQAIFRANGAEDVLENIRTYRTLSHANYRLGNYRDGSLIELTEKGLALVTKHHPHDGLRLSLLEGLSRAEQILGNHERSLALMEESVRLVESGVVTIDGIQRGGLYQSLGDRLSWAARTEESERYMRKAVEEYAKAGGPDHPYVADGKRALGILLAWRGRREEAQALLQSALESQQRVRGQDDPQLTTVIRFDFARVLLLRGDHAQSEPHLKRVIELWTASGQNTINPRIWLGRLYTEQGRLDLAAKTLDGIDEAAAKTFGPGAFIHAGALSRLGALHLARGDLDTARTFFERADRESRDQETLDTHRAQGLVGLLRIALAQRSPELPRMAQELLTRIESAPMRSDMPDEEAAAHMLLGVALARAGQAAESRAHLEKAVALRERMDVATSPRLAEARRFLAQPLRLAGT